MTKSKGLDLRIDPEMLEHVKAEAKKIDSSVAFVVRSALRVYLTERGYYATTDDQRASVREHANERKRSKS